MAPPRGARVGIGETGARVALGAGLLFAGTSHLTFARREFRAQVPEWLPLDADFVVLASGVVGLGAALVAAPPRRGRLGSGSVLRRDLFRQHLPVADGPDAFGLASDTALRPAALPPAAGRVGALVDPDTAPADALIRGGSLPG
ncbi:MAG: DoxX family rane protein [Naasia sp.]|nr:DoxX family rane protein [Naasia sp.]